MSNFLISRKISHNVIEKFKMEKVTLIQFYYSGIKSINFSLEGYFERF